LVRFIAPTLITAGKLDPGTRTVLVSSDVGVGVRAGAPAGIGHSLVLREADQLIRLSTGAMPKPPSPAVRNHRNAVRLALESVSALRRIPHSAAILRKYAGFTPREIVSGEQLSP
jgi:hypothetical protein